MRMNPEILRNVVAIVPAALIAVALHEVMHGYVADKLGDRTARINGRLTLNPIAHIDMVGALIMPALLYIITKGSFLFGYAKPVPVNPFNLNNPKRDMAIVAASGPATNLALALISAFFLRVLSLFGGTSSQVAEWIIYPFYVFFQFSIAINVILFCFNLIPIPPLDGGRILVGLLPIDLARAVSKIEPFGVAIVLILVVLDPLGIASYTLFFFYHVLVRFMSIIAGVGGF